jgi:hypothetical protein
VLAGEGALALAGVATAGHGAGMMYKITHDPLNSDADTQSAAGSSKPPHGNSLDSTRKTTLYELLDEDGNHLRYGITSEPNPLDRYTRSFME